MIRMTLALFLWAGMALAQAPTQSLRPETRSAPVHLATMAAPVEMRAVLRPLTRPGSIAQKAMAKRQQLRRGAVCGDLAIQGEEVGPVPGRIAGCGIERAMRITSVAGVALSQSALMDCGTAKALKTWIEKAAVPAFRSKGGGLSRLRVAAHYACRTRNSQTGARISEHGKGRAIDISAFYLRDGAAVTVLEGWRAGGSQSRALRKVHQGACGPFGTVLGPESDRFHRDHFHFDTARYRSGPYCR